MNATPATILAVRAQDAAALAHDVEWLLALFGGVSRFVSPGDRVLLKPNWVAPFPQAVTDWTVILVVAEAVRAAGGVPFLGESSGFEFNTAATLRALGLYECAAAAGLELLNLDDGPFVAVATDAGPIEIARAALEADAIVNLPRLKRHSLTDVTAAQKNLLGLVSRDGRRRLHARDIDRGIVALNGVLRPRLHLLDGRLCLSRAVYGQAENLDLLLASDDPLALDCLGARLLGQEPHAVRYLRLALQARAGGAAPYQVLGDPCDECSIPAGRKPGRWYARLFQLIYGLDLLVSPLLRSSLIPYIHYWLGIRPHLVRSRCTRCGICIVVCPVQAIQLPTARISARRCMQLRCLRCVDACPEEAIEVRGWRRPAH